MPHAAQAHLQRLSCSPLTLNGSKKPVVETEASQGARQPILWLSQP
jgi:hypothetical protein